MAGDRRRDARRPGRDRRRARRPRRRVRARHRHLRQRVRPDRLHRQLYANDGACGTAVPLGDLPALHRAAAAERLPDRLLRDDEDPPGPCNPTATKLRVARRHAPATCCCRWAGRACWCASTRARAAPDARAHPSRRCRSRCRSRCSPARSRPRAASCRRSSSRSSTRPIAIPTSSTAVRLGRRAVHDPPHRAPLTAPASGGANDGQPLQRQRGLQGRHLPDLLRRRSRRRRAPSTATAAPAAPCGRLFDFCAARVGGGPVVLPRARSLRFASMLPGHRCQRCTATAASATRASPTRFEARAPVPLDSLPPEDRARARFTIREAIDGEDRNGDGDTNDTVVTLRDRATGVEQPLGAPRAAASPGAEGRGGASQIQEPPFSFPALAVENDVLAFLESRDRARTAATRTATAIPPTRSCASSGSASARRRSPTARAVDAAPQDRRRAARGLERPGLRAHVRGGDGQRASPSAPASDPAASGGDDTCGIDSATLRRRPLRRLRQRLRPT